VRQPRWVLLGGRVRPAATARVAMWSPAVRWGAGLYETVGCERGRPLLYQAHLHRLADGAQELGWALPTLPGEEQVAALLARSGLAGPAALRLLVAAVPRGLRAVAWGERFRPPRRLRREGAALFPLELAAGPLAGVKTCDRFALRWANRRARAHGFTAALLVDVDGMVRESDHANVFALIGDQVVTPPTPRRCLPGVVRGWTIGALLALGVRVVERDLPVRELIDAQGAWLTSSLEGLVPLRRVGDAELAPPTPLLARLVAAGVPVPGYLARA
jgi:branched-subunit amino acid aminotransferase/4-amino-4-deoxychorismate lyase